MKTSFRKEGLDNKRDFQRLIHNEIIILNTLYILETRVASRYKKILFENTKITCSRPCSGQVRIQNIFTAGEGGIMAIVIKVKYISNE